MQKMNFGKNVKKRQEKKKTQLSKIHWRQNIAARIFRMVSLDAECSKMARNNKMVTSLNAHLKWPNFLKVPQGKMENPPSHPKSQKSNLHNSIFSQLVWNLSLHIPPPFLLLSSLFQMKRHCPHLVLNCIFLSVRYSEYLDSKLFHFDIWILEITFKFFGF